MRFLWRVFAFTVILTTMVILLPRGPGQPSHTLRDGPPPISEEIEAAVNDEGQKPLSQQLYELQGRGASSPQERAAAELLAAYFQEIGLDPWPEYPTYLQEFPIGKVDPYWENGRLRFRSLWPPQLQSQNVIGYLPGRDPEEKWVIFGAHYDGQGEVDGTLYPSANDNLSGIMALTALAKVVAQEPRHNYTLVFVAFGAEEPGLLGSSYLTHHLPVPVEKIKAMINLDTIGKTSDDLVIYTTEHNALTPLLAQAFYRYGFGVSTEMAAGISDHYPFALQGIPSATVATVNWRAGNHSPGDTLDELDRTQIGKIAGALKYSLAYLIR